MTVDDQIYHSGLLLLNLAVFLTRPTYPRPYNQVFLGGKYLSGTHTQLPIKWWNDFRLARLQNADVCRRSHFAFTYSFTLRHSSSLFVTHIASPGSACRTPALDQTIVATALPTLVRELGGASAYSWVGSAYLLMAACLAPRESLPPVCATLPMSSLKLLCFRSFPRSTCVDAPLALHHPIFATALHDPSTTLSTPIYRSLHSIFTALVPNGTNHPLSGCHASPFCPTSGRFLPTPQCTDERRKRWDGNQSSSER